MALQKGYKDDMDAEKGAGYGGSKGSDGQKSEMGVKKAKLDGQLGDVGGKDKAQYKDSENIKKQGMGE